MRRLPKPKMDPEQVRPGQLYHWHKRRWHVDAVNRFSTSDGMSGTIHMRRTNDWKRKTVDLVKFAGRARLWSRIDEWRERRS